MNETIYLVAGGVGLLIAGIGLGYWAARLRVGKQAAKARDVQKEFDDYRNNVTEHFGRTAEHFQAISHQYRELYLHMASGADALCDPQAMDEKLSFKPAAMIESLANDAASVQESSPAPRDYADGDDAAEIEQSENEPVAAEEAQAEEPESGTKESADVSIEKVKSETRREAGDEDSQRVYH
jgi:uncharacterized membrane-anchored protein YhcB (DUF1043 family)